MLNVVFMNQQFLIDNILLITVAVVSGGMLFFSSYGRFGRISANQASVLLNRQKALLLDLRDEKTIELLGGMPGSRTIEFSSLKAQADTLAKDKTVPVVLVCENARRSDAASRILKAAGYTQISILDGGFNAWVEAGLPIKREKTIKTNGSSGSKATN